MPKLKRTKFQTYQKACATTPSINQADFDDPAKTTSKSAAVSFLNELVSNETNYSATNKPKAAAVKGQLPDAKKAKIKDETATTKETLQIFVNSAAEATAYLEALKANGFVDKLDPADKAIITDLKPLEDLTDPALPKHFIEIPVDIFHKIGRIFEAEHITEISDPSFEESAAPASPSPAFDIVGIPGGSRELESVYAPQAQWVYVPELHKTVLAVYDPNSSSREEMVEKLMMNAQGIFLKMLNTVTPALTEQEKTALIGKYVKEVKGDTPWVRLDLSAAIAANPKLSSLRTFTASAPDESGLSEIAQEVLKNEDNRIEEKYSFKYVAFNPEVDTCPDVKDDKALQLKVDSVLANLKEKAQEKIEVLKEKTPEQKAEEQMRAAVNEANNTERKIPDEAEEAGKYLEEVQKHKKALESMDLTTKTTGEIENIDKSTKLLAARELEICKYLIEEAKCLCGASIPPTKDEALQQQKTAKTLETSLRSIDPMSVTDIDPTKAIDTAAELVDIISKLRTRIVAIDERFQPTNKNEDTARFIDDGPRILEQLKDKLPSSLDAMKSAFSDPSDINLQNSLTQAATTLQQIMDPKSINQAAMCVDVFKDFSGLTEEQRIQAFKHRRALGNIYFVLRDMRSTYESLAKNSIDKVKAAAELNAQLNVLNRQYEVYQKLLPDSQKLFTPENLVKAQAITVNKANYLTAKSKLAAMDDFSMVFGGMGTGVEQVKVFDGTDLAAMRKSRDNFVVLGDEVIEAQKALHEAKGTDREAAAFDAYLEARKKWKQKAGELQAKRNQAANYVQNDDLLKAFDGYVSSVASTEQAYLSKEFMQGADHYYELTRWKDIANNASKSVEEQQQARKNVDIVKLRIEEWKKLPAVMTNPSPEITALVAALDGKLMGVSATQQWSPGHLASQGFVEAMKKTADYIKGVSTDLLKDEPSKLQSLHVSGSQELVKKCLEAGKKLADKAQAFSKLVITDMKLDAEQFKIMQEYAQAKYEFGIAYNEAAAIPEAKSYLQNYKKEVDTFVSEAWIKDVIKAQKDETELQKSTQSFLMQFRRIDHQVESSNKARDLLAKLPQKVDPAVPNSKELSEYVAAANAFIDAKSGLIEKMMLGTDAEIRVAYQSYIEHRRVFLHNEHVINRIMNQPGADPAYKTSFEAVKTILADSSFMSSDPSELQRLVAISKKVNVIILDKKENIIKAIIAEQLPASMSNDMRISETVRGDLQQHPVLTDNFYAKSLQKVAQALTDEFTAVQAEVASIQQLRPRDRAKELPINNFEAHTEQLLGKHKAFMTKHPSFKKEQVDFMENSFVAINNFIQDHILSTTSSAAPEDKVKALDIRIKWREALKEAYKKFNPSDPEIIIIQRGINADKLRAARIVAKEFETKVKAKEYEGKPADKLKASIGLAKRYEDFADSATKPRSKIVCYKKAMTYYCEAAVTTSSSKERSDYLYKAADCAYKRAEIIDDVEQKVINYNSAIEYAEAHLAVPGHQVADDLRCYELQAKSSFEIAKIYEKSLPGKAKEYVEVSKKAAEFYSKAAKSAGPERRAALYEDAFNCAKKAADHDDDDLPSPDFDVVRASLYGQAAENILLAAETNPEKWAEFHQKAIDCYAEYAFLANGDESVLMYERCSTLKVELADKMLANTVVEKRQKALYYKDAAGFLNDATSSSKEEDKFQLYEKAGDLAVKAAGFLDVTDQTGKFEYLIAAAKYYDDGSKVAKSGKQAELLQKASDSLFNAARFNKDPGEKQSNCADAIELAEQATQVKSLSPDQLALYYENLSKCFVQMIDILGEDAIDKAVIYRNIANHLSAAAQVKDSTMLPAKKYSLFNEALGKCEAIVGRIADPNEKAAMQLDMARYAKGAGANTDDVSKVKELYERALTLANEAVKSTDSTVRCKAYRNMADIQAALAGLTGDQKSKYDLFAAAFNNTIQAAEKANVADKFSLYEQAVQYAKSAEDNSEGDQKINASKCAVVAMEEAAKATGDLEQKAKLYLDAAKYSLKASPAVIDSNVIRFAGLAFSAKNDEVAVEAYKIYAGEAAKNKQFESAYEVMNFAARRAQGEKKNELYMKAMDYVVEAAKLASSPAEKVKLYGNVAKNAISLAKAIEHKDDKLHLCVQAAKAAELAAQHAATREDKQHYYRMELDALNKIAKINNNPSYKEQKRTFIRIEIMELEKNKSANTSSGTYPHSGGPLSKPLLRASGTGTPPTEHADERPERGGRSAERGKPGQRSSSSHM